MTKIFLDTEFTGLHQNTTLISIALVAETGEEFYAELDDYDENQVDDWVRDNVISKLEMIGKDDYFSTIGKTIKIRAHRIKVAFTLRSFFSEFEGVEIWADVLAYDWVLFCELFGGAMNLPDNIFYAPFDLATLLRLKGHIEPVSKYEKDVSRFEFVGVDKGKQHHALEDARVELKCYKKIYPL